MADVYFISEAFLKNNSVIDDNTSFKILSPTIILVQDVYLQKILGTPLYNDLKAKMNADITLAGEADYKDLVDNYITKTLLWYILMESTPNFKYRYMNKGVMVKSGENSAPSDLPDLKWLMDKWRINAEQYAEILTSHLKYQHSQGKFPLYSAVVNEGLEPIKNNYSVGIYLD